MLCVVSPSQDWREKGEETREGGRKGGKEKCVWLERERERERERKREREICMDRKRKKERKEKKD